MQAIAHLFHNPLGVEGAGGVRLFQQCAAVQVGPVALGARRRYGAAPAGAHDQPALLQRCEGVVAGDKVAVLKDSAGGVVSQGPQQVDRRRWAQHHVPGGHGAALAGALADGVTELDRLVRGGWTVASGQALGGDGVGTGVHALAEQQLQLPLGRDAGNAEGRAGPAGPHPGRWHPARRPLPPSTSSTVAAATAVARREDGRGADGKRPR
ncbi:hypothetical protein GCM10009802_13410 [Streptomyces synnematoformans]|uniref:Uncharacterized protein n=1 Tax=Streptomyces synnematoformans TaxID=415721 RepID=A0ABP5JBG9_9ACTN